MTDDTKNNPNKENPSLTQSTGISAFWQVFGGSWQAVVRIVASMFLARALTPEDFGLFGMAILVYEFLTYIGALGMGTGIIAKQEVSQDDLCTCFWTMAAMRTAMFLGCFLGAPLAAVYFGNNGLTNVLRAISFTFLLSIFEVVSLIILIKELQYKTINLIRGIAVFLEACVAISLALTTDLGYWSLVLAMIASAMANYLAIFIAAKWMPKFIFSQSSFRYLFRFGINTLGSSIMNYFTQNIDYILVGRMLGAKVLGLYEFAYRIPHIIELRIAYPISSVLFPSLSKVQGDNQRLITGYLKLLKFICLVTFPALAGLAAVADSAVLVLWGDQWVVIIPPLQILCFCTMLRIIPQASGAVLYCKKRPDLHFKISVCCLVWTVVVVLILGKLYGVMGIAWGMLVSVFPAYLSVYFVFKLTQQSPKVLIPSIGPILLSTVACALGALAVKTGITAVGGNELISLGGAIISGIVIYVLSLCRGFSGFTREMICTIEEVLNIKLFEKLSWLVSH